MNEDDYDYESWKTIELERYGQVKLSDPITNIRLLISELKTTYWGTIDSILWSTVNVVVFAAFCWLLPIWTVLQFTLRTASKKTTGIPHVYKKYNEKLTNEFWLQLVEKLTHNTQDASFDLDLAEFHAVLTSLANEPVELVDDIIKMWNRDIGLTYHRFGHEGCVITMVYSVQKNFVVLAFKGSSVFNLSEWLIHATTRKIPAKNSVLPGLVHAGFYSALGFSTKSKATPDMEGSATFGNGQYKAPVEFDVKSVDVTDEIEDRHLDEVYEKYDGSGEGLMKVKLIYLKRQFGEQIPHLWITGHSLGAATATIFTSVLLWKRTKRGKISGIYGGVDIDSWFKLHGTFTFGSPRVGDSDWKDAMETILQNSYQFRPWDQPKYQFWRIINANDIVCSIPPTTLGSFLSKQDKSSRAPGLTLNDFHHLGTPLTLGYHGSFHNWDKERTIQDMLRNLVTEWVSVPVDLLRGSYSEKIMAILTFTTLGTIGLVRDHDIGEYIKNLQTLADLYERYERSYAAKAKLEGPTDD
ncbi:class 3-domain-containing protein [Jimgerdemannia flammicorona]|uniref:Class 3-domain-containing protein n=2 Tax=Jimgerdemannia flammicorona TaxID=994334 RepID=A0A433DKJ7_9FUNG|nr:class 3-domain-containing protein [Jimgerdemannia flammicorona]RUS35522.1 class 3-domain-containing protein [Jimgerdemannia flammicorona]